MSHTLVNTWGANDELTSAQQNALALQVSNSVDKTTAGDTIAGPIALSGAGRVLPGQQTGANADTTYTVGTAPEIRVTSAVTSDRVYTLSATGVATNDRIKIWCDSTVTNLITVKDQAAATLIILGPGTNGEAAWAEFIYSSGWKLHSSGGPRSATVTFTSSGTATAPRWATRALLEGCGGGGGGGAGREGTAVVDQYTRGGGGGAAAKVSSRIVAVTGGSTYAVTIGAGGTGGAASTTPAAGTMGGTTSFSTLAYFLGGRPGYGYSSVTNNSTMSRGGSPTASTQPSIDYANSFTREGDGGNGGTSSVGASAGGDGPSYVGGAASAAGADDGTYRGGGGAGGGGSNAFGTGGAGGIGEIGADLGSGGTGGNGQPGTAGTANTGCGGGGGGGGGAGETIGGLGGAGGAGGSGILYVTWLR